MAGEERVTLTLQGERAREGVTLAAFESFVEHFLGALRYHYRSGRSAPIRKPGRPFGDEDLATAFRLVAFRTGSGIAVLEPVLPATSDQLLADELPPTLAWDNMTSLFSDIESQELDDVVASELKSALRALGHEAHLTVEFSGTSHGRYEVDESRLEPRNASTEESDAAQTVVGLLHAIDLEPDKLAVRTPSGVDWNCEYPPSLELDVLRIVGKRVIATGIGRMTSAKVGTLTLESIAPLPEVEQTHLFSAEPVPLRTLQARQRITSPQGTNQFVDPEWSESEESELFLHALLDEDE